MTASGPVELAQRIRALDTTRGVAVLGILLMNIWSFAGPQAIYDYPVAAADWGGAPLPTWAVMHTLFEGSQRALFSMLFGAGMLLMVNRLDERSGTPGSGRIYYRRLMFLLLFGLFDLFVLLWPADILFVYGLCGLVLYPLRRRSVRTLLVLACAVFAAQATLRYLDLQDKQQLQAEYRAVQADPTAAVPGSTPERLEQWAAVEQRAHPDLNDPKIQESIRVQSRGALGEFLLNKWQTSLILLLVVGIKSLLLDSLGAMLVGMALLRSGVLTLNAPRRVYWFLLAVGYGLGLPLAAWETAGLIAHDFDPLLKARNLLHYDVRRMAVGVGHLSAILLACQAWPQSWLAARLASVGRMALSNYLGQSLLCGILFYSVGFGLYGRFTGYYLYLLALAIWVVQILLSHWWLARFRFGPCEWLWKSLTYSEAQPMRTG